MITAMLLLVLCQSPPPCAVIDAVRDANERCRPLFESDKTIISSAFRRDLSIWIDPNAVQFSLVDDNVIESRVVVRHPNPKRYRTNEEQHALEQAAAELEALNSSYGMQRDSALASGHPRRVDRLTAAMQPGMRAAAQRLMEVRTIVTDAERRRRDAVEIVPLTIIVDRQLAERLRTARDPIRINVAVIDFELEREPPEIGRKFHVCRLVLKRV